MFKSFGSIIGFLVGAGLTVGLLVSPHLIPWDLGYEVGFRLLLSQIIFLITAGLIILTITLWLAGRLIKGAQTWKEPKVILAVILIAFVANALYVLLVEFFELGCGMRALIATVGVPVIYGNLGAVIGKTSLKDSMQNIFSSVLATMGAGFIISALILGWKS